jgi:hypothetical protein
MEPGLDAPGPDGQGTTRKKNSVRGMSIRRPSIDYPVCSPLFVGLGGAMKYLCLIYDEEKTLASMSKAEMDALMGEYFAFTRDISKSGHFIGGNDLKPVHAATTVRVRNGKVATTDGPFAETKEQLGGYYLIEARDLDDAIQVAARIPSARLGSIEVRPVQEHPQP